MKGGLTIRPGFDWDPDFEKVEMVGHQNWTGFGFVGHMQISEDGPQVNPRYHPKRRISDRKTMGFGLLQFRETASVRGPKGPWRWD